MQWACRRAHMYTNRISALKGREHTASCSTYRLVAKQDVDVRHDLHQRFLKKLADERCGEVHAEDFVVIGSVLRYLDDWLRGHSQEKTLENRTIFIYLHHVFSCLTDFSFIRQMYQQCTTEQAASFVFWQHKTGPEGNELLQQWTKTLKLLICGFWILTEQV